MKQHKRNCFKVRWGIFSFFSSTNVETKNVCPIAYNGWVYDQCRIRNHKTIELL